METWMALKVGLKVRAFFPAVNPSGSVLGEYLTVRVTGLESPLGPDKMLTGVVLDEPEADVGYQKGDEASIPMEKVEEIVG